MSQLENQPDVDIENRTREWVSEFVVKLGLCPFAHHAVSTQSIRYSVSKAQLSADLLQELERELDKLQENEDIQTSLLIIPTLLPDFDSYLDFLFFAEQFLAQAKLEGIFQLASFHPDYQFEGTTVDAAENYTNRSPYPVLHILRESDVEHAIAHYDGDGLDIAERNIKRMQELGSERLARVLRDLQKRKLPPIFHAQP